MGRPQIASICMRLRRSILGLGLVLAAVLALAACGDDASTSTTVTSITPAAPTTLAAGTAPSPTSYSEAPTPVSADPAPSAGDGSSPADALPRGREAAVGDWLVALEESLLDADEVVAGYNEFNQPPEEGSRYVMVKIRVTAPADVPGVLSDGLYALLVGSGANEFGTVPAEVPGGVRETGPITAGVPVTVALVFEARSEEVEGAVLVLEPTGGGRRVHFALE